MKTTINQESYDFEPDIDETAIDVVRHRCGMTGSKLVCGSGVCGACTMLVDGKPMTGCLLPAHHIEGKTVTTVEHYSPENLHPIQKAFMAHDGLQCGYCTPGFIMEGIAFYDRWRAEHGTSTPSREQVTDALAGHLCRCGAYVGIYEAIQRACAGEYDDVAEVKSQRVDALEKVTGQAKYTTDIQLERQLIGKILRSPYAHATITAIDLSPAQGIDGVKAVIPMIEVGEKVRYNGQSVAAVAAVDHPTADRALKAIQISFDVHKPVIGIEDALAEDAPTIWDEANRKNAPLASEGLLLPGTWDKNLRKTRLNSGGLNPGRAQRVFDEMQRGNNHTVSGIFTNGIQVHTALEPHCAVAHWRDESHLDMYLSTQGIKAMQADIAKHYELEKDNVTVIAQHVGGGFGAKNYLPDEAHAAIKLAKTAGAPVSVIPNRPEEMNLGGMRPGGQFEMKLASNADNELSSIIMHSFANGGVAVGSITAAFPAFMYSGGARDLLDMDVVNNTAPGKPFRGPGGPGAIWAMEQAVDQIAHDSGVDPITLRRKWTKNDLRIKLYDWVENLEIWKQRPTLNTQSGRYRRGVGVAFGVWIYVYDPEATVQIETSPDGLTVKTATQDIGNGVKTSLARLVAEPFGIDQSMVNVQVGNTTYPHGPTAAGSRVTVSIYEPTREGATLMRDRLFGMAAEEFDLENAQPADGGIYHTGGMMPWTEVLEKLPPQQISLKRGADRQISQRLGAFVTGQMGMDLMFGWGISQSGIVAEVEVDTLLGKTQVKRVWQNLAIGKAHFPDMARSQVYGGVIQAMGYALYEEKIFDKPTGNNLTSNLQDYRIAGIGDIPEIYAEFTDGGFDHVKGNGIGLSELSTIPVAASIANAVFNATGVRSYESPIKPERLILALNEEAKS